VAPRLCMDHVLDAVRICTHPVKRISGALLARRAL
jgi:hypothetical protein